MDCDVRTHFNLHTEGYTVDRWSNAPTGSCGSSRAPAKPTFRWLCQQNDVPELLLTDAYFRFDRSKWAASLRSGVKGVYAWVLGCPGQIPSSESGWLRADFDQQRGCFVDRLSRDCLAQDGSVRVWLRRRPRLDARGKTRMSGYMLWR